MCAAKPAAMAASSAAGKRASEAMPMRWPQ